MACNSVNLDMMRDLSHVSSAGFCIGTGCSEQTWLVAAHELLHWGRYLCQILPRLRCMSSI